MKNSNSQSGVAAPWRSGAELYRLADQRGPDGSTAAAWEAARSVTAEERERLYAYMDELVEQQKSHANVDSAAENDNPTTL